MTATTFLDGRVLLHAGDCLTVLDTLAENSVDSVVCDPPYHLTSTRSGAGFMGKQWDGGDVAFQPGTWAAVLRVLKPGGYLLAFSGTRTYHRMGCAIEDAGFDIRDQIQWLYGSGFPKSLNIGKAIDKAAGAQREVVGARRADDIRGGNLMHRAVGENERSHIIEITAPATEAARQWDGWGTALKPACEPICMARKPFKGTNVENILRWGTGALNIDGCRIESSEAYSYPNGPLGNLNPTSIGARKDGTSSLRSEVPIESHPLGRWPANLILDGSDEVLAAFPDAGGGFGKRGGNASSTSYGFKDGSMETVGFGDSGSAARFFYSAKADQLDRLGSKHPTVKPLDLMQYLVRLVTPPGGLVLDCFAGTGTTGEAAYREGMRAVLIEREPEYQADIARRMELVGNPTKRSAVAASRNNLQGAEGTPLFGGASDVSGGGRIVYSGFARDGQSVRSDSKDKGAA